MLIHTAARALRRRFEASAHDIALTSSQWRVLVVLRKEGPQVQARLAEHLEIEPISVSRLIDRMVQGGWVERLHDPADRRSRLVSPTAAGQAAMDEISGHADEVYAEALSGFSVQETQQLRDLLQRVADNLSTAPVSRSEAAAETETEQDRP